MATNTATDSLTHDVLLGKTVGGRYVIERLIGRGGVGLVYLANDTKESRELVIKVLAPHWAQDSDAVARFDREALRMAQLEHKNVVRMYDHGHFEGRAYIVMEFIRGEPLRRYLDRHKRLSLEEFIPIASQILLGAGYVHERGIMMRDIKPPNIMLAEQGNKANHVKLLDFGLAKLIEEEEEDEITKAHVIGTAAYMSPEQIRGDKIDVRVDVYALGVLFFLMLTGEQPIAGDNDAAVLVNHVHGKPKSLAERLPKGHRVPDELIALIESCLAKEPDDRPDDATAMAEALFEFIPPALFELPDANTKTREAAETYWSARMHSGPVALAELDKDVSDSAEWTRPLLRRAAETGQAPLKLAEAEVAAQKAKVQTPVGKSRRRSSTGSGLKPRPRSPTGSGLKPRPRSHTGSGLKPRRRMQTNPNLGPPPKPPKSSTAARRAKPKGSKQITQPAPIVPPLASKPGNATIRVTAADAKEAVERIGEELDNELEARDTLIPAGGVSDDPSESRDTLIPTGGGSDDPSESRETLIPTGAPPDGGREDSDVVPISMDGDDLEEIEEFEEFEAVEASQPVPVASVETSQPVPLVETSQPVPLVETSQPVPLVETSQPNPLLASIETSQSVPVGVLTSGGYMAQAAPPPDGMRLGAIVAVAGLVALALGGLTAFLVLGGGGGSDNTSPSQTAAVAAPKTPGPGPTAKSDPGEKAADAPESTVGSVEVRAIDGATVEIDGEDKGQVPVSIELPVGEHRVKVTAEGHHPWQTTIDVKPGANAAVKAELVEAETAVDEPAATPKTGGKKPKTGGKKPKPKTGDKKPKTTKKKDVFMGSDKGGDGGIFMPVGGK